jgi:hypothetical protein
LTLGLWLVAAAALASGCRDKSEHTPPATSSTSPAPVASVVPATTPSAATSASVVSELGTDEKETRLYSGAAANLLGDGVSYLVVGGYTSGGNGRAADVAVYKQEAADAGGAWSLQWQSAWQGAREVMVRNVAVADLDKDGKDEIIVLGRIGPDSHHSEAQMKILGVRNSSLAVLAETRWQGGKYTHGYGLAVTDIDGDGVPEIATSGFFFDGARESGDVRVWKYKAGELTAFAKTSFGDPAYQSTRINSLAVGDLDGDGHPEIVVGGRDGSLKAEPAGDDHAKHYEQGMIAAFSLKGAALEQRARFVWKKGAASRVRAIELVDLDGDHHAEVLAAGQAEDDGKPSLGLFKLDKSTFTLVSDASFGTGAAQGEIKDVVMIGKGNDLRVATAGAIGQKPARQGSVQTWKITGGKLQLDKTFTSTNGDETRARGIVAWPGATGTRLLTIGHAKGQKQIIGQLLDWGKGS